MEQHNDLNVKYGIIGPRNEQINTNSEQIQWRRDKVQELSSIPMYEIIQIVTKFVH